ncbi:putative chromosome partitioning protein ParB [Desulforapulum autotrophicum HRM2]|uniref:Chromosome partitioning protein ParB n=1 Tax=Desulforapulum autotrophicum (strain ATCC 43914 / DSM 3382 / VKM B-1955 / HRM2) TaxID=177437 RepID=C0QLG5_DESAH|nr:ParB/RepB/Spo0J family partition protein [Desulforapulum autotrophicum]ACN16269.1 putative chromosome partitioning protein ParB [Desulforapulum autotrophicum HRM2]
MSKKKKLTGLGRGISALIPDLEAMDENTGNFFMCKIEEIVPNRFQPRINFVEEELEKLKESIIEQGILQPLLVRRNSDTYELIAGERRLRAAQRAKFTHVPALVRDLTDEQMLEVSIIENIQRQELNPLEEAEAYHRLISEFNYTQEKVARRIGKNRSTIANLLRLRGLPDAIHQSLAKHEISTGHARAILGAGSEENQIKVWLRVVEKELSVRATEQLVQRIKAETDMPSTPPPIVQNDEFDRLSSTLSSKINSTVKIKHRGDGGRFEIGFKTREEFQRLVELFNRLT